MRRNAIGLVLLLVAAACGDSATPPSDPDVTVGASSPPMLASIPSCEDVPSISAPTERYRDTPTYVGNEQPVDEVRAWAATKPGFEDLFLDREHRGWITLVFSEGADARQAELEEIFPDVGVVAVGVDWTAVELSALQERVGQELAGLFPVATGWSPAEGVVRIGIGIMTPERVEAVEDRFAGERVCIEGTPVEEAPPPGEQPRQGEGWRLLAAEPGAGEPYRTGIATDDASYATLWDAVGLAGEPPVVDFQAEIVIWFGAVFGSSCPDLRLDDVIVDEDRALLFADVVLVDPPPACTSDANPYAFVVAVERDRLPAGPLTVSLSDDESAQVIESRVVVGVDLSAPGAVAAPGDLLPAPVPPGSVPLVSGAIIEPGVEATYLLYVHCGIEWLGEVNDVVWRTDVPAGQADFVPESWRPSIDAGQTIEVIIRVEPGPPPTLVATTNEHAVTYRPATETWPGCD